ncbi:hypothetical protein SNE40_019130 [Patella caerulea]|uniref:Uncharacterized protein n=1 Tax=Patella caerulea TaxID=87958 RepID=A0AAN8J6H8_PATCE
MLRKASSKVVLVRIVYNRKHKQELIVKEHDTRHILEQILQNDYLDNLLSMQQKANSKQSNQIKSRQQNKFNRLRFIIRGEKSNNKPDDENVSH